MIGGLRSKLQNFRGKLQEEETLNQRCVRYDSVCWRCLWRCLLSLLCAWPERIGLRSMNSMKFPKK